MPAMTLPAHPASASIGQALARWRTGASPAQQEENQTGASRLLRWRYHFYNFYDNGYTIPRLFD
jgi:hypothetical protein